MREKRSKMMSKLPCTDHVCERDRLVKAANNEHHKNLETGERFVLTNAVVHDDDQVVWWLEARRTARGPLLEVVMDAR